MPRVKGRQKKLAKAAWQRSRESRASSQGECLRARAPLPVLPMRASSRGRQQAAAAAAAAATAIAAAAKRLLRRMVLKLSKS